MKGINLRKKTLATVLSLTVAVSSTVPVWVMAEEGLAGLVKQAAKSVIGYSADLGVRNVVVSPVQDGMATITANVIVKNGVDGRKVVLAAYNSEDQLIAAKEGSYDIESKDNPVEYSVIIPEGELVGVKLGAFLLDDYTNIQPLADNAAIVDVTGKQMVYNGLLLSAAAMENSFANLEGFRFTIDADSLASDDKLTFISDVSMNNDADAVFNMIVGNFPDLILGYGTIAAGQSGLLPALTSIKVGDSAAAISIPDTGERENFSTALVEAFESAFSGEINSAQGASTAVTLNYGDSASTTIDLCIKNILLDGNNDNNARAGFYASLADTSNTVNSTLFNGVAAFDTTKLATDSKLSIVLNKVGTDPADYSDFIVGLAGFVAPYLSNSDYQLVGGDVDAIKAAVAEGVDLNTVLVTALGQVFADLLEKVDMQTFLNDGYTETIEMHYTKAGVSGKVFTANIELSLSVNDKIGLYSGLMAIFSAIESDLDTMIGESRFAVDSDALLSDNKLTVVSDVTMNNDEPTVYANVAEGVAKLLGAYIEANPNGNLALKSIAVNGTLATDTTVDAIKALFEASAFTGNMKSEAGATTTVTLTYGDDKTTAITLCVKNVILDGKNDKEARAGFYASLAASAAKANADKDGLKGKAALKYDQLSSHSELRVDIDATSTDVKDYTAALCGVADVIFPYISDESMDAYKITGIAFDGCEEFDFVGQPTEEALSTELKAAFNGMVTKKAEGNPKTLFDNKHTEKVIVTYTNEGKTFTAKIDLMFVNDTTNRLYDQLIASFENQSVLGSLGALLEGTRIQVDSDQLKGNNTITVQVDRSSESDKATILGKVGDGVAIVLGHHIAETGDIPKISSIKVGDIVKDITSPIGDIDTIFENESIWTGDVSAEAGGEVDVEVTFTAGDLNLTTTVTLVVAKNLEPKKTQ